MNINQIKLFTWLISAGVTAGVGYYVYEFNGRSQAWNAEHRIPAAKAKEILESAKVPEGPKASLVDRRAIERAYYFDPSNKALPNLLDWSGTPPKKVVVAGPKVDEKPAEPTFKSIAPLIQIVMCFAEPRSPERGIAHIQYLEGSGVKRRADGFPVELRVGDQLAKPLEYATVKAIEDGAIVFSFENTEREDETVRCKEFDPETVIHVVSDTNPEIKKSTSAIPVVNVDTWRPQHTTKIDVDIWRIGEEDAKDFAEDFGGILAREVSYSRHFDRKTNQYDGIELKEVKAGGKIAAHGGASGDIIKSINGHPVTSPSEAMTYVKNNQDKFSKWIVVVENKGKERTMTFESPPSE